MRSCTLVLSGLFVAVGFAAAFARDIPKVPSEFVYDEAQWLEPREERQLIQQLLQFERETSNQIMVAVFRSLEDEELADFSQRVAEAWGIGQGERDNGILLAIYADDRKFSIEVGYGLEGAVTDLIASQILENELRPALRDGRRFAGIVATVNSLIAASRGEYEGTGRANTDRNRRRDRSSPFPFYLIPIILFVLLGGRGRRRYLGPVIFSSGGFGGGRGGFGGGGFGGGSFGGGGGSFGGGGARGGW